MKSSSNPILILLTLLLTNSIGLGEEWKSLFNERDLIGWRANIRSESFSVVDGAIRANATKGRVHLYYVGDLEEGVVKFKNFELELSARSEPNSNSGVFIHTDMTTRDKRFHLAKGYEIQLNSRLHRARGCPATNRARWAPYRSQRWCDRIAGA